MAFHDDDSGRGAAVYSPLVLKLYDAWVLGLSNRLAWQCPTREVLLPFFQQHLSANHLDVGVGSGYYLAKAQCHPAQQLALLDLSEHSLTAAAARVPWLQPQLIQEDVLRPGVALGTRRFDSISLFYLLHCLPGNLATKGDAVFGLLAGCLADGGTLYGATILGDEAGHNWLGRRLMAAYNSRGIFGNRCDTAGSLERALQRHFSDVSIQQHGRVALFAANTSA